jgi:SAM-dependent methyltransferase
VNNELRESIRESYNRLAEQYAARLFKELANKPLDRELLDRFASQTHQRGKVCDMGCGPGQIARYLRDAGADVFGLDLSPQMLEQARKLNPDVPFYQGDMTALNLEGGSLAGIAAFYAIVNLPERTLPSVFQEFHRVLQPGGLLLLSFHTGDEVLQVRELWGEPIAMDFFFFQPTAIRGRLEAAGFGIDQVIEREPYAPEVEHQSRRAYIFARKPDSSATT